MRTILAIICAAFLIGTAAGQDKGTTSKLTMKNGVIMVATPGVKSKSPDAVYKIVNGIKIYKGAKGGLYYYRVSKSGKTYKAYIKES